MDTDTPAVPAEIAKPDATAEIAATPEQIEPSKELADMRAALKKANAEAASSRKRLEALDKAEADRKSAEMTDLQKAQDTIKTLEAERDEIRKQSEQTAIKAAIESEARKLNWARPEVAYKLIEDFSAIEFNAGKVSGVEAVLKSLTKDYPEQIKRDEVVTTDIDAKKRSQRAAEQVDDATLREEAIRLGVNPLYYKRRPVAA